MNEIISILEMSIEDMDWKLVEVAILKLQEKQENDEVAKYRYDIYRDDE